VNKTWSGEKLRNNESGVKKEVTENLEGAVLFRPVLGLEGGRGGGGHDSSRGENSKILAKVFRGIP